MLATLFKQRYVESLEKFSLFYDDFCEYGNQEAENAFYFVPGIDGVPGQVRFALPTLMKVFGDDIYLRCLHLQEFSARWPIWEKFTRANVDKKRDRIVLDLRNLAARHRKIFVVASSSGFYDFLYAYPHLDRAVLEKTVLIWVAVAPDHFRPTPWESIFYRLNGFVHNGFRWFAAPNANAFAWINPEATTTHTWTGDGRRKLFFKNDLESRLSLLGLQWSFNSLGCFNDCLAHAIEGSVYPIPMRTFVLVATNDGYWQGRPLSDIDELLDKYLSNKHVIYRHASHLWVLVPDNLRALLCAVHAESEQDQPGTPLRRRWGSERFLTKLSRRDAPDSRRHRVAGATAQPYSSSEMSCNPAHNPALQLPFVRGHQEPRYAKPDLDSLRVVATAVRRSSQPREVEVGCMTQHLCVYEVSHETRDSVPMKDRGR